MKGYGLPRNDDVKNPDKADITLYGLKGYKIKSKVRQSSRRIWKKLARRNAKEMIQAKRDEKSKLVTWTNDCL